MTATTPPWMNRLAHDLRGALTPVLSALFLLRQGDVQGGERDELFNVVDRQLEQLLAMIEELGDWVQTGNGSGVHEPLVFADVIDSGLFCSTTPVDIEYQGEAKHAHVHGDHESLSVLLSTYLSLLAPDMEGQLPCATLTVDSQRLRMVGRLKPEMAHQDLDHLFLEPRSGAPAQGLGLRLPIAGTIARAHGGVLRAVPDISRGVVVLLEIPIAPAPRALAPRPTTAMDLSGFDAEKTE